MYVQSTHTKIDSIPSSEPVVSTKEPSVLVLQVFTSDKEYCRWMYPKIFESLTYKNKYSCFIDKKQYPELDKISSDECRAAAGNQIGINIARKLNVDWLLMLDLDTEPDPDCIEKMLSLKYPLVGGLHSETYGGWFSIGHNYVDRQDLYKTWLSKKDLKGNPVVDFISGGMLLLARGIYCRVDYTGYKGPHTIPLRYTSYDEFLQIKIFKSLKIRPKVASNCKSWHYSDDGRAFRLWGDIKTWRPA